MEKWMSRFPDRKFRELRIVGTHHSACYEIDGRDPIESSFSKAKVFALCFPGIFESWSKCQFRKVETQLRMGVRYFDIRVAYTNKKIYVAHSFRGPTLTKVLDAFLRFYDEEDSGSEICVLRFRPDVGNKKTMACEEAQEAFRNTIQSHRIAKYINSTRNPFDKKLRELRDEPIIVIFNHGLDAKVLGFGHHVPRYFNHWLRTDDLFTLRERMKLAIEKVSKEQKEFPLTVCQNILTPCTKTIVYSILYRVLLCVICPVCIVIYVAVWWRYTETCRTSVPPHLTVSIPFLVLVLFRFLTRPTWRLLDTSRITSQEFIKNFCRNPDANKDFNVITVDGVTTEFCSEINRLNENDKTATAIGVGLVTSSSKEDNLC